MQGAQTESRFRGIGRYTIDFTKAVVRNCRDHEVILVLNGALADTIEPIRAAFDGLLPQKNIRIWYSPYPVKESELDNTQRREHAEVIREAFLASLKPDMIHITSLFEGYVDDAVTSIKRFDKRTPVSVVLYDLIPALNPDEYLKANQQYSSYYERKLNHLKNANLLLAISEYSRQEGLSFFGESLPIINISTAISDEFKTTFEKPELMESVLEKTGVSRPMVLYTGGADARKNLPRLIEAWAYLPIYLRKSHRLVFAGDMSEGQVNELRQIASKQGLQVSELNFTGYITDTELVQLYNQCKLYIFPSWHEGFGLPALEAMACGAAVIGSNTSSLPEVIGLEEALFDPFDTYSIADKIKQALVDESFRNRLQSHGVNQARKFSWDDTALRAIKSWEALIKKEPNPISIKRVQRQKPKLAFVSPLPPERTGIADYSAELLPALAKHYDIVLIVDQEQVDEALVDQFGEIRDANWLRSNIYEIHRVVYQIGNSPFHSYMLPLLKEIPGTVVLHDFFLSGLMHWRQSHGAENSAWTNALYESHGYPALREYFKTASTEKLDFCVNHYPSNIEVLKYAQGLIVHSKHSCDLAQKWYGCSLNDDWRVIPLLRAPSIVTNKIHARQELGIDEKDFVVCSFGFLAPSKLNHLLLSSWIKSQLSTNKHCRLVFVGENHGGTYGSDLIKTINDHDLTDKVTITGFTTIEVFRKYLSIADVAVQLRTSSRGETSAAIFDAMNYGLPVIVNANGSMAELDREAVWMLPDEFNDIELVEALEEMWKNPQCLEKFSQRAKLVIEERHTPDKCAELYAQAIEHFHQQSNTSTPRLIKVIANQYNSVPDDDQLMRLSSYLAVNFPLKYSSKRLLLDVTATCQNDLKTGIERVARSIVLALLESPPEGYRVEPVYLIDEGGAWHYKFAHEYTLGLLGCNSTLRVDEPVLPISGDILITLDLSGNALMQAGKYGLFKRYRNIGVHIYSIVFDLLPILQPDVFPVGADQHHLKWLNTIKEFDGAICISKSVADELGVWFNENTNKNNTRRPFTIDWLHLGADVHNSAPTKGLPDNVDSINNVIISCPTFLMVGTVEPRKGYLQTLNAFNELWQQGVNVNLVIVGHEGWKGLPHEMRRDIPETIECLRSHPQINQKLFWLEAISDEYLQIIYDACTCLIAPSYGEGFGLPLIEAAQKKKPIIARDIPVFREVAGEHAYYFADKKDPKVISQAVTDWLYLYKNSQHPKSDNMPWLTWKQSANQLLNRLKDNQIC